jgi:DNA-binding NarL/FixJ family response regulator
MTRVLVVIGIRLYREGLAQLLGAQDGFTVAGAESSGASAAMHLDRLAPDVALVEMGVPGMEAISRALVSRPSPIPLVAIGMGESVSELLACAERGAVGYVTKDASVEELTGTIRRAALGECVCTPHVAGALIRRLATLALERTPGPSAPPLTRREREVAALMGEDLSNKEIATRLRIEVATVKNHVHNVLDKLQVHRRAEAARLLEHDRRPSAAQAR